MVKRQRWVLYMYVSEAFCNHAKCKNAKGEETMHSGQIKFILSHAIIAGVESGLEGV